jgi:hypothetical protein
VSFWNLSITHGFHPGGCPSDGFSERLGPVFSFVYPAWALALVVRFIQHNAQHIPTSYLDMLVHCALVRSSNHDAARIPTNLGAVNKRQDPIDASMRVIL